MWMGGDRVTSPTEPEAIATSTEAPPGSLIGYLVVLRENDAWNDTWDGTVYADAEAAMESCMEAFEAGYDVVLAEVRIK